ncbi:bifunctional RNase H/acid phosphatase [Streptomyces sp. B6B3]|uniref:bifunctional RNase H/acid phosphatase n=1 Tax=Streptomyces sp. B6B3 TaxID=3153570 RepID=UPI00325E0B5E
MNRSFIIEADGGSRGNPGPAGYGAVVREARSGQALAETAAYIGRATNNVAEYRGLIAGLRAAHALDPNAQVRVRMDSKLVVEQMSGRWRIKHPDLRPLATEAAGIFPRNAVRYEWIPRERNRHADRLANEAMDAGRRGQPWRPENSTADDGSGGFDGLVGLDEDEEREALAEERAAAEAAAEAVIGRTGAGVPDPGEPAGPGAAGLGAVPQQAPLFDPAVGGAPGAAERPSGPAAAGQAAAAAPVAPPVGWDPPAGAPTTFLLLRHGETALTPHKRFSGSSGANPELSPVGWQQAETLAAAFAGRDDVTALISSPLLRCRQTAEAVALRLNLDVHQDKEWRETDFGAWEGLTFAEVRERHPDDLAAWLASAEVPPTGGGESFAEVARRVAVARDRAIARYPGRTILVVTHVTPIKTLLRLALGAPAESMFRIELSAASLSEIAYYPDGNASVRTVNLPFA